ncbi:MULTISPECIES: hypothetical protein [unclassified Prochlorococcus]|uniref:hypothetical protein n=1 Tax=unclassified Prochlorococcus TaxID=2627481 RepID=UPI00055AE414|nr:MULTISPECIES: hypothetical protein [unclassified Prochlorococcus]
MRALPARLPPAFAGMALLSMAIGAVVLITGLTLLALPVMLLIGFVVALVAGVFFGGWALIEVLAALESWMERDPRFQR